MTGAEDKTLPYDLAELRSVEPYWKLILSSKALLPLLWAMYPGHPALLPSFYDVPVKNEKDERKWVSKPLYGREGVGVLFSALFADMEKFIQQTKKLHEYNHTLDQVYRKTGKAIYQYLSPLPVIASKMI